MTSKPPCFNGENYSIWKIRMKAYFESLDLKIWSQVENGYIENRNTETEKQYNKKGLNALFTGVSDDVILHIANCTDVKDAWDILQGIHEGNEQEKNAKLIDLTSEWESLVMDEYESFDSFYVRLLQNINASYALGKVYEDSVIVSKILRSLPSRFDIKKESIIESKDITKLSCAEVVGKMRIFEKGLRSNQLPERIVLSAFEQKKHMKKGLNDGEKSKISLDKLQKEVDQLKNELKKNKGVQCRECGGYGHFASKCGNKRKTKRKFTRDDSGSYNSSDDEEGMKSMVVKSRKTFDDSSSDEETKKGKKCLMAELSEISDDSASNEETNPATLNDVSIQREHQVQKEISDYQIEIKILKDDNVKLINKNKLLEEDLERHIQESLKLKQMLSNIKVINKKQGLGYDPSNDNVKRDIKFVKATTTKTSVPVNQKTPPQQLPKHTTKQIGKKQTNSNTHCFTNLCSFCGRRGHVRKNCWYQQKYFHYTNGNNFHAHKCQCFPSSKSKYYAKKRKTNKAHRAVSRTNKSSRKKEKHPRPLKKVWIKKSDLEKLETSEANGIKGGDSKTTIPTQGKKNHSKTLKTIEIKKSDFEKLETYKDHKTSITPRYMLVISGSHTT